MTLVSNSKRTLPWMDNIAYSMGNFGSNLIFGMITFYMMYFYTDIMGISAAAAGTLFLVARFWDAINDPIMGSIVDKTHTKMGKFRPFIIIGIVPCAVLYVLTFTTPDLSATGKVIWAFATYIPLGMVVTFINIPYHAQTTIMSDKSIERAEVGAVSSIAALLATLVVAAFTMPLLKNFATPQKGFVGVTTIFGVAMIFCYLIAFVRTKKYDLPSSKDNLGKTAANRFTLKEKTHVLTKNRPLMALMFSYLFFQIGASIMAGTAIYFFKYYLNISGFYPVFMGVFLAIMAGGMLFVPVLTRFMGKKNLFQFSNAISGVFLLITFIMCAKMTCAETAASFQYGALFYIVLISSFFSGQGVALVWGMIPDTVEYAELKVGIRSEGLVFALLSFMMKAGLAIAGALSGAVFTYIKYEPNQVQTESTLFGMLILFILIPVFMKVLTAICMFFYNLSENQFAEIVAELKKRKEQDAAQA
jgi:GPH family glycoside/pentoside/hexuronide:cation symporter